MRRVIAPEGVAAAVLCLGLASRLLLLGGPLDVPDWRQADTAYMAYRMWQESPPQVLHPKTPFRGSADVKAAEFPVYPLVVSLVWKLLGRESLAAARLVSLAFFSGAVVYAFLAVRLLAGRRVAWFTAAAYALLPLGIPYSRMVHPDFCIIFFCHAFLYHAAAFVRRRRLPDYAAATAAAALFFLMKAPYGFYLILVPAAMILNEWRGRRLAGLALLGSMFAVPLALGWWFNLWRISLEAGHQESLVYPMKWTAESLRQRFFGTVAQRLEPSAWSLLVRRSVILVWTVPGALLALFGGAVGLTRRESRRASIAFWVLCGGVALYTLLVFPMVASDHEYYSLPYLLPAAFGCGLGLDRLLAARVVAARRARAVLVTAIVYLLLAVGSAYGMRRGPFLYGPPYFSHDWQRIAAGELIEKETGQDDLVLTVTLGRSTGWSDPRILYYAHRRGWARDGRYLTEKDVELYVAHGATVAALLLAPGYEPTAANFGALAGRPHRILPLHDAAGRSIGHLVLFDLRSAASGTAER